MERPRRIVELAKAAIFAAFVAAATMVFSVFVAATGGFFNVGEIMVYTAAILGGPFVGAFAGGVGSMIADLALGFPQFAPGTLVIKGTEGFIVGYLVRKMPSALGKRQWRLLATLTGAVVATLVALIGTLQYTGEGTVTLGLPGLGFLELPTIIPQLFWLVLAAVTMTLFLYAGFAVSPTVGWVALSVLAGGAVMVTGYFLYEVGVLQLGLERSLVEVPVNVGQLLVGLLVALPLTRAVLRISSGRVPVRLERVPETGNEQ